MEKKTKYHSVNRDFLMQVIQRFKKPFTAKDIADALADNESALSVSTIYRLLDEFTENGALRKVLGDNNTAKYYYLAPCENENHFYLECSKCHTIYHLDCRHLRSFTKHISKKHHFDVSNYQLIISGLCVDCQEQHA